MMSIILNDIWYCTIFPDNKKYLKSCYKMFFAKSQLKGVFLCHNYVTLCVVWVIIDYLYWTFKLFSFNCLKGGSLILQNNCIIIWASKGCLKFFLIPK